MHMPRVVVDVVLSLCMRGEADDCVGDQHENNKNNKNNKNTLSQFNHWILLLYLLLHLLLHLLFPLLLFVSL